MSRSIILCLLFTFFTVISLSAMEQQYDLPTISKFVEQSFKCDKEILNSIKKPTPEDKKALEEQIKNKKATLEMIKEDKNNEALISQLSSYIRNCTFYQNLTEQGKIDQENYEKQLSILEELALLL